MMSNIKGAFRRIKENVMFSGICAGLALAFSGCAGQQRALVFQAGILSPSAVLLGPSAMAQETVSSVQLPGGKLDGGVSSDTDEWTDKEIEIYLNSLTLEEKTAQLFIVLPEALIEGADCVTDAGEQTKAAIDRIPVGGFIYLDNNLRSEEQVKTMLANVQSCSNARIGLPAFLCVDEEGGTVARIGGSGSFGVPVIQDMSEIGRTQDLEQARRVGVEIGGYLSRLGFNVDFAPVADVLSNPDNKVVRRRSFGTDPEMVSNMSLAVSDGLKAQGIYSTYKHFPGHGATAGDTHAGYAYTDKTLEELKQCELIPFQKGIEKGIPFMMVGHISLPNVTGDNTPASLSPYIINDLLREEMGYDGIVVTDALNMGAIVQQYTAGDAAVKALQAGADVILMPSDFNAAYQGVIEAVQNGSLSRERIDESLRRILRVKLQIKNAS